MLGRQPCLLSLKPQFESEFISDSSHQAAIAVATAIALTGTAIADAKNAAAPPGAMLVHGYNLCKVTNLAALSKATGKNFTKATKAADRSPTFRLRPSLVSHALPRIESFSDCLARTDLGSDHVAVVRLHRQLDL
jgi:hypothetical protein